MNRRTWRTLAVGGVFFALAGCTAAPGSGCSPDGASTSTTIDDATSTTEPNGSSTTTTTDPGASTTTTPGSTTTTEAPGSTTSTTLPAGDSSVRVEALDVESCFDPLEDAAMVDRVTVVDCDDPHRMEVFDEFELDPTDLPGGSEDGYPGANEITWAAQDECQARFRAYTGEDYFESRHDITTITPSFSTWDLGDRAVTCVIIAADGGALTGSAKA